MSMKNFRNIQKEVGKHQSLLEKVFYKAEATALSKGDAKLSRYLKKESQKVLRNLDKIREMADTLLPVFQQELRKRTQRLEVRIGKLNKSKETLSSDNLLLEYKKKDLLLLTTRLEEANEEISLKNRELMEQQRLISEVREELLRKNQELEAQKESLLDQSDYLHEANETITKMHQEVEAQKDEILRKNDELLKLNNEKNNLIGIVAHDLKSPLNQIKGLLNLMRITSTGLSPEALSYIEMMEKSSGRLSDMIAKILDVEAIESRTLNLSIGHVDVSALLSSLVERHRILAAEKQITLHCDAPEGMVAAADKSYTEQVFENLLSNAIKFSPHEKNVYVSVTKRDDKLICEVRDEGPGLTDADKKKLFGKYQKLSAKPTGNETSTGLGLSIVRKFVVAMNGRIWCESEAGKGASFFVALPIAV